jgi:hypothetical protein
MIPSVLHYVPLDGVEREWPEKTMAYRTTGTMTT